jgi:hypothetical protein
MIIVFLSHASTDYAIAAQIRNELQTRGFLVRSNQQATLGDNLAIDDEVQADLVVVLWSTSCGQSDHVRREMGPWMIAWSQGKFILARLDNSPLPPGLRDLRAVDLSALLHTNKERAVAALASELRRGSRNLPSRARLRRTLGFAALVESFLLLALAFLMPFRRNELIDIIEKTIKDHLRYPPEDVFLVLYSFMFVGGILFLLGGLWSVRSTKTVALPDLRTDGYSQPNDVFVSFSSKDNSIVNRVVGFMKDEGFSPWIYTGFQDTNAGRFAGEIVRAIKASRKVAMMCSDSSFQSDEVVRELYLAGDARKPFVAFFLDRDPDAQALPEDFQYFLTGYPFVPVKGRDAGALRNDIRRFLSKVDSPSRGMGI